MDYDSVSAAEFGQSLSGLGLNLLTPDVCRLAGFLAACFGARTHRLGEDFAISRVGGILIQMHHDRTYANHALAPVIPESGLRGGGAQFYLFGVDPDGAAACAAEAGGEVIEAPRDKPHGLRECTILSPEGYAFSPAVGL